MGAASAAYCALCRVEPIDEAPILIELSQGFKIILINPGFVRLTFSKLWPKAKQGPKASNVRSLPDPCGVARAPARACVCVGACPLTLPLHAIATPRHAPRSFALKPPLSSPSIRLLRWTQTQPRPNPSRTTRHHDAHSLRRDTRPLERQRSHHPHHRRLQGQGLKKSSLEGEEEFKKGRKVRPECGHQLRLAGQIHC